MKKVKIIKRKKVGVPVSATMLSESYWVPTCTASKVLAVGSEWPRMVA